MEKENIIAPINEELNVEEYGINDIKNMIYTVRGKQVMVDSDVAMLYHYETKYINLAVRRNKERFPNSFCFQLDEREVESIRLQNATASNIFENKFRNKKYLPYVFTEQGIAMLSGLLKNEIAVQVSINIMNTFVEMRKYIANNGLLFQKVYMIKEKLLEHDSKFDEVFNELQKYQEIEFK